MTPTEEMLLAADEALLVRDEALIAADETLLATELLTTLETTLEDEDNTGAELTAELDELETGVDLPPPPPPPPQAVRIDAKHSA